jgi:hypothetical protein
VASWRHEATRPCGLSASASLGSTHVRAVPVYAGDASNMPGLPAPAAPSQSMPVMPVMPVASLESTHEPTSGLHEEAMNPGLHLGCQTQTIFESTREASSARDVPIPCHNTTQSDWRAQERESSRKGKAPERERLRKGKGSGQVCVLWKHFGVEKRGPK